MSNITIAERIALIQSIEIQQPSSPYTLFHVAAGEDSAAVADGSAISFVGTLDGQMKFDVLNSTLYAQLVANSKYNRQNDAINWYNYYKSVLDSVGWKLQSFELTQVDDAASHGSIDQLLLDLAAKYLTGGELELFQLMINSLKQPKNSSALKLLESSATSYNKANFQTGVASIAQGKPQFKIGVFICSTSQKFEKLIFMPLASSSQKVSVYADNQTMLLDDQIYATVRQAVLDKLGSNAQKLVDAIII